MKVNVSLDGLDVEVLAKVMASMPSRDPRGLPARITPQDAIRWALQETAKRS